MRACVLLALAVAASAEAAVRLEVGGSVCAAELRAELSRTRGVVVVDTGGAVRASLVREGTWRLELRRGNEVVLARELKAADACADVALGVGVIVERYAHDVELRELPRAEEPRAEARASPQSSDAAHAGTVEPARAGTGERAGTVEQSGTGERAGTVERAPASELGPGRAAPGRGAERPPRTRPTARPRSVASATARPVEPEPSPSPAPEPPLSAPPLTEARPADPGTELRAPPAPPPTARASEGPPALASPERAGVPPSRGESGGPPSPPENATAPRPDAPAPLAAAGTEVIRTKAVVTITEAAEPPQPTPPAAPPPEPRAEAPTATVRVERPTWLRVSRLELLVDGAVQVGASVQPAVGAEVALLVGPLRWSALFLGTPLAEATTIAANDGTQRGTLSTRSFLAAATAAWCFDTVVEWCPGLLAGARLATGAASGPYIFHASSAWLGTPSVGPTLHLAWPASRRLFAALDLVLLVNALQPGFVVEGLATRLPFTTLEGHARLSVGFTLWR